MPPPWPTGMVRLLAGTTREARIMMVDLAPSPPQRQRHAAVATLRPATGRGRRSAGTLVHLALAAGGLAVVGWMFPALMGTTWAAMWSTVSAVSPALLVGLLTLWVAGLVAHTVTLTAAMPGLRHNQALTLSLTGSAVANVLPVGGAAGVALNCQMASRWGFTRRAVASYTVITNLWDVLAKVLLPLVLIPVVLADASVARQATHLVVVAGLTLPAIGGLAAWLLFSPTGLRGVERIAQRLCGRSQRWSERAARLLAAAHHVRSASVDLARRHWPRLTFGMAAYTGLLFLLLWACLAATGAHVPVGLILVAVCGERLATLIGVTPGGIGFVEIGLAAVLLLAPDSSGTAIAAGVLLYRLLTFGLEIPVGGALLALWARQTRSPLATATDGARS